MSKLYGHQSDNSWIVTLDKQRVRLRFFPEALRIEGTLSPNSNDRTILVSSILSVQYKQRWTQDSVILTTKEGPLEFLIPNGAELADHLSRAYFCG